MICRTFGLFIVADGMGGHQEGERASAITTRIVARHVLREIYAVLLSQKMDEPERPSISDVLRAAVQEANEVVTEQIPEGGTTVTSNGRLSTIWPISRMWATAALI